MGAFQPQRESFNSRLRSLKKYLTTTKDLKIQSHSRSVICLGHLSSNWIRTRLRSLKPESFKLLQLTLLLETPTFIQLSSPLNNQSTKSFTWMREIHASSLQWRTVRLAWIHPAIGSFLKKLRFQKVRQKCEGSESLRILILGVPMFVAFDSSTGGLVLSSVQDSLAKIFRK